MATESNEFQQQGILSDMSIVIEGAIDIDFLEVLPLTIGIELTIFES